MADIKRDTERDELFRTIYKIATDLVHAGHVAEWVSLRGAKRRGNLPEQEEMP